jgi:hypothetical protein
MATVPAGAVLLGLASIGERVIVTVIGGSEQVLLERHGVAGTEPLIGE